MSIVERVRAHLQLYRAHSAPGPVLLMVAGYLAVAEPSLMRVGGVAMLGVLAHLTGFGHNTLMDREVDAEDENKRHHPLHDGRLGFLEGLYAVNVLQVVALSLAVYMAWGNAVALVALLMYVVMGHAYNDGAFSSRSLVSWLPISTSFAALVAFAMYYAGSVDWWLVGYVFVMIWIQTDLESKQKDITTTEPTMIRMMGARVGNGRFHPGWSWVYTGCLQVLQALFLVLVLLRGYSPEGLIAVVVVIAGLLYTYTRQVLPRTYDHEQDLQHIGFHEVFAVFGPLFVVAPLPWATGLALGGLAWYLCMNRFLWGAWTVPRT